MSHPNARLTPGGRLILVGLVEQGFTQGEVARRLCLSRATVGKWWRRYQAEGRDGLDDRSSAAQLLRHKLDEAVVTRICDLRKELGEGPHRLAGKLKLPRSTIYGVLRRPGRTVASHAIAFAGPEVELGVAVTINEMQTTLQAEGPTFEI